MKFFSLAILAAIASSASAAPVEGNSLRGSEQTERTLKRVRENSSADEKKCSIEALAGSFKLEYDFFSSGAGAAGDYIFSGSAALTFSKPAADGSGVMIVNYCFGGDNSNPMVAVQTGFVKKDIIPITIAKYEADEEGTYNDYSISGEYDCDSNELSIGFTSYFEGNAFTPKIAVKSDALNLNGNGCLP
eukprot:scaffold5693_cov141-Skeletonema_menzelii.AAC.8